MHAVNTRPLSPSADASRPLQAAWGYLCKKYIAGLQGLYLVSMGACVCQHVTAGLHPCLAGQNAPHLCQQLLRVFLQSGLSADAHFHRTRSTRYSRLLTMGGRMDSIRRSDAWRPSCSDIRHADGHGHTGSAGQHAWRLWHSRGTPCAVTSGRSKGAPATPARRAASARRPRARRPRSAARCPGARPRPRAPPPRRGAAPAAPAAQPPPPRRPPPDSAAALNH